MYLGISASKFDELRKASRICPARIIGGRKVWDIRALGDIRVVPAGKRARRRLDDCRMSPVAFRPCPAGFPPGCVEDRDRHGNIRIYYRAKGSPKVRLRGTPWLGEFMAEYEAAKAETAPSLRKGINPGTWRWLCVKYFTECADYLRYDDRQKRVRRGIWRQRSMNL